MYFMEPFLLFHKVMPCTSPILPGPGTNPYYDLPQENDEEGQPHVNCGPQVQTSYKGPGQ